MTHSPAIREMDTRGGGGDEGERFGSEASPETAEEEMQRRRLLKQQADERR